ncbi:hypothetical protein ACQI5H_20095 [Mycobacterium heidelbergense]|uniref:hypothetical protein n=1 Tax=Mycobacterium heidelbergense TaxID=53376 RepID=UPI003CEF6260
MAMGWVPLGDNVLDGLHEIATRGWDEADLGPESVGSAFGTVLSTGVGDLFIETFDDYGVDPSERIGYAQSGVYGHMAFFSASAEDRPDAAFRDARQDFAGFLTLDDAWSPLTDVLPVLPEWHPCGEGARSRADLARELRLRYDPSPGRDEFRAIWRYACTAMVGRLGQPADAGALDTAGDFRCAVWRFGPRVVTLVEEIDSCDESYDCVTFYLHNCPNDRPTPTAADLGHLYLHYPRDDADERVVGSRSAVANYVDYEPKSADTDVRQWARRDGHPVRVSPRVSSDISDMVRKQFGTTYGLQP